MSWNQTHWQYWVHIFHIYREEKLQWWCSSSFGSDIRVSGGSGGALGGTFPPNEDWSSPDECKDAVKIQDLAVEELQLPYSWFAGWTEQPPPHYKYTTFALSLVSYITTHEFKITILATGNLPLTYLF